MKNQKCNFFQINNSKNLWRGLLLLFCALGLTLSLETVSLAQNPDSLLFKIIKRNYENATAIEQVLFIYESGRIDCGQSKQTPTRKARFHKTIRCHQITKDKISELTEIAEQTDFLNAMDSYRFFDGGKNLGSSATIIYYREDADKIILLGTPRTSENETTPPDSINEFLEEIQGIDETMKLKYELGNRIADNKLSPKIPN